MSLAQEIERYKSWASTYALHQSSGDWEQDYEEWPALYRVMFDFLDTNYSHWSKNDNLRPCLSDDYGQ